MGIVIDSLARRIVGMTAWGLFLLTQTAIAPGFAQQHAGTLVKSGQPVAGMDRCVMASFDNAGMISVQSRCEVPVEVMWFFGSGHEGTGSLTPGKEVSTGVNAVSIPELGVLHLFACPSSRPIFHDDSGEYLSAPVTSYHCDEDNTRVSNSMAPRLFTYDVLTSGDCVLQSGALTLNANGDGHWRARIHTNHTTNRDIWHVSLVVVDSNGRPLFSVPLGDSPAMYGSPSPTIPWAIDFSFEVAKFKLVDHVKVRTSC